MENIIIIAVLAVICIFAVRGCVSKKAHGCCGSGDTTKIKVRDKNQDHYPYTAEVTVEGMTCSNCKLRVENAFNEEGTMWASVDLKAGKATVRMKEEITDDEIRRLVSRAGYDVTEIQRHQR